MKRMGIWSFMSCCKSCFSFLAAISVCLVSNAQIIPDLTTGDHFLPHLSELQKQELVIKSFQEKTNGQVSQTSQKLYPQLYKYANKDHTEQVRGMSSDPSKAISDYSKTTFQKPSASPAFPKTAYNNNLSIEQRNRSIIDADIAAFETQNARQSQMEEQISKDFGPTINYHLGVHNGPAVDKYVGAYSQLQQMLSGSQKIDFMKAVWCVENAVDPSLGWEEFNAMFQEDVQIITGLMRHDKFSPKDNLAKLMSIYKFMTDTTSVFLAAKERNIVSKPFLYDFDDYEAKKDITKVFVSKLLRTGSGQCMSLPMLYYLYAKALGAEAYLAFAPEHTYITFKDNRAVWQNIELTAGMLTTSDFYWQSGFIKAEQVKSGIYLRPTSEKETIAYLLTTLTLAYVRNFGTDERVLEMGLTARNYFPNSLTANMIVTGYNMELWKHVLRQYQVYGLPISQLNNDEAAQTIKQQRDEAVRHIYQDLGWAKMPEWAYKRWLDGVNQLANMRQHNVRKRQLEQQLNR